MKHSLVSLQIQNSSNQKCITFAKKNSSSSIAYVLCNTEKNVNTANIVRLVVKIISCFRNRGSRVLRPRTRIH